MENPENKKLEDAVRVILKEIGDDPKREGVLETPSRVARAWRFWASGYNQDPASVMKTFSLPESDQMIIVRDIDFYSMCEHHMAPFYGQVSIGYIPDKRVLGVSKFARLIEIYARRLQIQERMTGEIADAIMKYLKPAGVGVVVRGIHLCMRSRGVEKQNTEMVTSIMLGKFRLQPRTKEEFLRLIDL